MSVTPMASVIYANQNTPVAAQVAQQAQGRADFQNMINGAFAAEQKVELQTTRPTEANTGVDPDREHQKQEEQDKDEEQQKRKTPPHIEAKNPTRILDVKV